MIEEIFKNKNLKLTPSRKKVYNYICDVENITTKKLIELCPNINKTTIYRIIDTFLENDLIDKKVNLSNQIYYEIKPLKHCHYITCLKCHKKEKIKDKYIDDFENNISKGYKVIHHEIDFVGICDKCRK